MLNRAGLAPRLKRLTAVPLYRNALYLLLSSTIGMFLGFFFWMTVARLYSTTEVGLGSAIIATVGGLIAYPVAYLLVTRRRMWRFRQAEARRARRQLSRSGTLLRGPRAISCLKPSPRVVVVDHC